MRESSIKREVNKTTIKSTTPAPQRMRIPSPGRIILGDEMYEGGRFEVKVFSGALSVLGRILLRRKSMSGTSPLSLGWHSTWPDFRKSLFLSSRTFCDVCEILCVLGRDFP